jgi:hypothetical protein
MASLKRFVATWMAIAPPNVQTASHRSKTPFIFQANTQPSQTGTIAATSVFGRVARRQHWRNEEDTV